MDDPEHDRFVNTMQRHDFSSSKDWKRVALPSGEYSHVTLSCIHFPSISKLFGKQKINLHVVAGKESIFVIVVFVFEHGVSMVTAINTK